MLKLYTDIAVKATENHAGIGILIVNQNEQNQIRQKVRVNDNHEGEFLAAIAGFEAVLATGYRGMVSYYSDSKLVIASLEKRYAKHYQPVLDQLLALIGQFDLVIWQWLPDSQNRGAHALALQGLHEQ